MDPAARGFLSRRGDPCMTRERIKSLLTLFGLPDSFSEQQLKQAYRDLVQVWHPDRHTGNARLQRKATEQLKEINEAEKILSGLLVNGRFNLADWTPEEPDIFRAPPNPDRPKGGKAAGIPLYFRWWLVLLGAVGVVMLVSHAGSRRHAPDDSPPSTPPGSSPPLPATPVVKSPRLDEHNGFKQFTFGMSRAQAAAAAVPDKSWADDQGNQAMFTYNRGPVARLDDYPLDRIELKFVQDQLYRIEVGFSTNQDKVFQAFTAAFGDSNPNGQGLRNGRPLRIRFWQGNNIVCSILADRNSPEATGWDTVVMSDQRLDGLVAATQLEELRADIAPDGFKALTFGMSATEVQSRFSHSHLSLSTDAGMGETSVAIPRQADPQLAGLGWLPLDEIRCHFFKDRLYRIDLVFSQNADEIFQAFMARFPRATANSSWLRGQKEMIARQWTDTGFGAAIMAPVTVPPVWDRVILFQVQINDERRKFNDEAPARAAKDI